LEKYSIHFGLNSEMRYFVASTGREFPTFRRVAVPFMLWEIFF